METQTVIIIVVIAVVAIALLGLVALMAKRRQNEERHLQAKSMRQDAAANVTDIHDTEAQAQAATARADAARIEAQRAEAEAAKTQQLAAAKQAAYEDQVRAADRLDPQVKTNRRDYAPDTSPVDRVDPATTQASQTARVSDPSGGVHTASTPVDRPLATSDASTQRSAALDADGHTITGEDGRVLDTEGRPLADPLHSTGDRGVDEPRNPRT